MVGLLTLTSFFIRSPINFLLFVEEFLFDCFGDDFTSTFGFFIESFEFIVSVGDELGCWS